MMDFKDLPRWTIVPLSGGLPSKKKTTNKGKKEAEEEKALREILNVLNAIKGGNNEEDNKFVS